MRLKVGCSRRSTLLLLQDKYEVPRGHVELLLLVARLALHHDLLVVLHPGLDLHGEDLLLVLNLGAVALGALVVGRHHLAHAVARAALGLHLLDHARADLADVDLDPRPVARRAHVASAGLGADTLARRALDLAREREPAGRPLVHLVEARAQLVHDGLALLLPSAAAAAHPAGHHVEDVGHAARARGSPAALLEGLLAVLVVDAPLLRILERVVRLVDLLELFRVAALVGVVLHRRLPERLLQLGLRRRPLDAEKLVVPLVVALGPPTHAPHIRHATAKEATPEHGERALPSANKLTPPPRCSSSPRTRTPRRREDGRVSLRSRDRLPFARVLNLRRTAKLAKLRSTLDGGRRSNFRFPKRLEEVSKNRKVEKKEEHFRSGNFHSKELCTGTQLCPTWNTTVVGGHLSRRGVRAQQGTIFLADGRARGRHDPTKGGEHHGG